MNGKFPKHDAAQSQAVSPRERLAESIYVRLVCGQMASQYSFEKYARQAREAAAVFYADEAPSPSVPLTKAV